MGLRRRLHDLSKSAAEHEADEIAEQADLSGCTPIAELKDRDEAVVSGHGPQRDPAARSAACLRSSSRSSTAAARCASSGSAAAASAASSRASSSVPAAGSTEVQRRGDDLQPGLRDHSRADRARTLMTGRQPATTPSRPSRRSSGTA